MNDRELTTTMLFSNDNHYTRFHIGKGDEEGDMWLSVQDGFNDEGLEEEVQCYLTIDQMEYVAKRMLDMVEYIRKEAK